jgi:Excalibur calcium-binding domain
MRRFMQKLAPVAVLVALVWVFAEKTDRAASDSEDQSGSAVPFVGVSIDESSFSCDGRTRCSQMTSCEEAMYFLEHCPGVEMDGGGDGIPCERQWCGHN